MYTNDDLQNLSEEEKKRQKRSVQTEMIILESDIRKFSNQKNLLDAEMRNLKINQDRIRIESDEKKKELEKVSYKITEAEEGLKKLKKKLNLL